MIAKLDIRSIESPTATEIYISATPTKKVSPRMLAEEIFSGISAQLHSKGAYILQERIFATEGAIELICGIRSKAYGDIDDGVAPSLLVGKDGLLGAISGVHVHAVSGLGRPQVLNLEQTPCGRILIAPGLKYLTLSGVSARRFTQPTEQAKTMLEKAESALKQFGGDFLSVARTWMWLSDILSWYGDFNRVRNDFFTERGVIGEGTGQSMPASTGIGLGHVGGNCAMDMVAVLEPANSIQYLQAVGKQQCAFEYGSAFSRAARAVTPAGETVFVSGTASIDASGATTHIADAPGQIEATIENVRAVLRDMNAADEDVVQVMAYCKTTDIEKIFNGLKNDLPWPWITSICDICRPDLLFEIEATAIPRN